MNDKEVDRSGSTGSKEQDPPADPDLYSPDLKHTLTDRLADALDLPLEDVQLRLLDGMKFWQIAQDELPSLEDVEEVCLIVQNQVFSHAVKEGWIKRNQAEGFKRLLYCELFPAAEMGDGLCRETRLPVSQYAY